MATTSKTCPACGRSYPADRKFCERDGSELTNSRSSSSDSTTSTPTPPAANSAAPKKSLSRETIAGGILVLVLVLVVGIVFTVREAAVFRLQIVFDEAHGLKVGDSVFVRGADVGEVVATRFDAGRFLADITVRKDGAEQLRQGSLFFVGLDKPLVNRRCLAVYIPEPNAPALKSGEQIRGVDSWFKYYGTILKDKGPAEAMRAYSELKGFVNQAAGAAGEKAGKP